MTRLKGKLSKGVLFKHDNAPVHMSFMPWLLSAIVGVKLFHPLLNDKTLVRMKTFANKRNYREKKRKCCIQAFSPFPLMFSKGSL